MQDETLKKTISEINTWRSGGVRAPHKPLLLLYTLGRIDREEPRLESYEQTKEKLKELLSEFGPPHPIRTNYPFVRLQNDGIWEVSGHKLIDTKKDWGDKYLIENETLGGFSEEVYSSLINNKELIRDIASILLEQNFTDSMHTDILDAVGLDLKSQLKQVRVRDSSFRDRILSVYEYSCAVCGFNVRLGHRIVAVEAAHIKWHQAGGPDSETNGIALCSMHHKLFDRGVFAINGTRDFIVAEMAHGTNGFDEWLMKYHGKKIRGPVNPNYQPVDKYLAWHVREVFRGPERYSVN